MTRRHLPAWLLGSGVIAVAMGLMNIGTYGFTILAARLLGPQEYGALAAMMGLMLVVMVLSLGLQATGARRVAAHPERTVEIEHELLAAANRSALGLGLLCLALTPVIWSTLRLDSWVTAALLAVSVVPLTIMGAQAGILQGERRWFSLAMIYLATGVGRLFLGGLALVVAPHSLAAMAGVAAGAFLPCIVGWYAIRHPGRAPSPADADAGGAAGPAPAPVVGTESSTGSGTTGGTTSLLREIAHNSHALLAFFALSNADVVLARAVLDGHDAGLYAGGLIMTKAVLFLPQFVVVVAFPSMSQAGVAGGRAMLKGLSVVLAMGALVVAVVAALSPLAVVFVGGSEYTEVKGLLWGFAALGTVLALLQMMVYEVVARQHQRSVWLIWGALAAVLVAAALVGSMHALLVAVSLIDTTLLVVLFLMSRRAGREASVSGLVPAATQPH